MNLSDIKTSSNGVRWTSITPGIPNETNDCVVRALAAAAGVKYLDAHSYAETILARKFRKGVSTHGLISTFYKSPRILGKRFSPIGKLTDSNKLSFAHGMGIKLRVPKTTYTVKGKPVDRDMTVYTFLKSFTKGSYFILVKGHAMAVVDGVLVGNYTDHRYLRKRLIQAFAVNN